VNKLIGLLQFFIGLLSGLWGLFGLRKAGSITAELTGIPERQPEPAPVPVQPPSPPPSWFEYLDGQDDPPGSVPDGYDGTRTLEDKGWAGLTKLAQIAYERLRAACASDGLEIFMTEGFRPRRRQAYLYALGRTIVNLDSATDKLPLGRTVTNAKPGQSRHQGGQAFDVALRGPAPYDASGLTRAGRIGIRQGLAWGGSWTAIKDLPHFEIRET